MSSPVSAATEKPRRHSPSAQRIHARLKTFEVRVDEAREATVLTAELARWGRHLKPLVVRFQADWLSPRDHLGTCYLTLPALAGPTTVLGAQTARRQAFAKIESVDCYAEQCSILPVTSREPRLQAYYVPEYETTRGLTSLDAGSATIRTDLSQPAPDGVVQGRPSWTCATRPPESFSYLKFGEPPSGDQYVQRREPRASGAVSVDRLGTVISQRNCASFAVIEESSAQVKRDLLLLVLGALLPAGFALLTGVGIRKRG